MLIKLDGVTERLLQSNDDDIVVQLALRDVDIAFADFIVAQEAQYGLSIGLLAAMLSQRLGQQDTCLDIELLTPFQLNALGVQSTTELYRIIEQANAIQSISEQEPGNVALKPIIRCGNLLYLQRYWQYETLLVNQIKARLKEDSALDSALASNIIGQLFDSRSSEQPDWQQVAVAMAASQGFSMITGGPGTGKTTTVAKLLVLLERLAHHQGKPLTVELVAPTGKAAARLTESIAQAKNRLPEPFQAALNVHCSTIHRLLGSVPNRVDFRHNQHKLLHVDVLIVDEASMVDLPLMCKLFCAIPMDSRIVLLGDQNQLSSVEAGSVLSDICGAAVGDDQIPRYSKNMRLAIERITDQKLPELEPQTQNNPIGDCLTILKKSHRFSDTSGIGKLAHAVISQQNAQVDRVLNDSNYSDISWQSEPYTKHLVSHYVKQLEGFFREVFNSNLVAAFKQFEQLQALCASRKGDWGVENINHLIEKELSEQGFIDLARKDYVGRPIMLSQNDHGLQVYNGDIGIIMPDPQQPEVLKAWFKQNDGSVRGLLISRLPEHETVYAMTIHKSQGSEFEHVLLCLPQVNSNYSLNLSRELLYTGLTRAKKSLVLYATQAVLHYCLQRGCRRTSGLTSRLR